DSEALEVFGGEVDPAPPAVLGNVLPVLDELKGRAHAVGQLDPLRRGSAEDVEDELADGVRGEIAVLEQLVERRVRLRELVAPVRFDQAEERLPRQRAGVDG